jgi:hypothetical protein
MIDLIVQAAQFSGFGHDGSFNCLPLIVLGDAGCGKTYAGQVAAKRLGWQFAELYAMHYSPSDVIGARTIPLDGSDSLKHYLPDWAKNLDPDQPAIILIDEVTKALLATNNALLGGVQERRSGAFRWGTNWQIVMTGNLTSAKAGDRDLPSPMRSRAGQFIVRNTTANYLEDYAYPQNLHYAVTSFLKYHDAGVDDLFPNGVLNTWSPDDQPAAYACERSWDNMSKILAGGGAPQDWACSMLGNNVGNVFIQHCEVLDQVPDLDTVLVSPSTAPVTDEMMIGHYVGNMLAYHATKDRMEAICTYMRRYPAEVATKAITEAVRRHPECKETQAYVQFRCEYKLSV